MFLFHIYSQRNLKTLKCSFFGAQANFTYMLLTMLLEILASHCYILIGTIVIPEASWYCVNVIDLSEDIIWFGNSYSDQRNFSLEETFLLTTLLKYIVLQIFLY